MSIFLLLVLCYLAVGVLVAGHFYDTPANSPSFKFSLSVRQPLRVLLKRYVLRVLSAIAIVALWPMLVAAELSADRRYRMAAYVDDDFA
jgi:hypothetical protein